MINCLSEFSKRKKNQTIKQDMLLISLRINYFEVLETSTLKNQLITFIIFIFFVDC